MNFKRLSREMLIAGADERLTSTSQTWDRFWSKCGQPIFLNKDGVDYVYVIYRGMASREWSPNDATNTDRQGVSQIGYMRWTLANWPNGAPVNANVAPLLTASIGTLNGYTTPLQDIMAGQSAILRLGEWNDHVVISDGSYFYMFVSLFYQNTLEYYKQRDPTYTGTGVPGARIVVLRTPVASFPTGWTFHGTARRASDNNPLGTNIGPLWINDSTFFMAVPDGDGVRRVFSCATSTGGINNVWNDRGATFGGAGGVPKSTRYKNMIVGRAFKEGGYVYMAMPSAHMFTDWPSAINLYRISTSDCDSGTGAISSGAIIDYPLNPIFQRGPNEGGVWQLCPVCDSSGTIKRFGTSQKIYATYQTWSILNNVDDATGDAAKVIGNDTAKGLRTNDYFGLGKDTGYTKADSKTHKHIGVVEMTDDLALSADWTPSVLTAASYHVGIAVRLKNKAHASYLLHAASAPTVTAGTSYAGNAGWAIKRCTGDNNYVYLHPAGQPTRLLTPKANANGGRRDAALDMELVTMSTASDSGVDAEDMSWNLAWNKGLENDDADHPENFHVQWLAQLHEIGGVTYLRLENRESSLSLTCEKSNNLPTKARQRFPLGADFELWEVEAV